MEGNQGPAERGGDVIGSFEWRGNGARLDICRMRQEDIPAVTEMYNRIAINAGNHRIRLDGQSPYSFNRTGGMFIVQSADSIEALLHDDRQVFIVAKDERGAAHAMVWITAEGCGAGMLQNIAWDEQSPRDLIYEQCAQNSLIYNGEIIVLSGHLYPGAALCMLFVEMYLMKTRGFTGMCGEVYRVCAYEHGGRRYECDLFNGRSYNMLLRSGAVPVGRNKKRIIRLPELAVEIEPAVVYREVDKVFPEMLEMLDHMDINVRIK